MGIPYDEVAGWPREKLTLDGFAAVRKLRCAWADRITLAAELDANGQGTYPDNSHAYMTSILIEPYLDSQMKETGEGLGSYDHATLSCNYSTQRILSGGYVKTEQLQTTRGLQSLSHEKLYWGTGDSKVALEAGEHPNKLITGIKWTVNTHGYVSVPAAVLTLAGKINGNNETSAAFGITFAAGTLLHGGATVTHYRTPGGTKKFTVQIAAEYRYNGGLGWNGVWRQLATGGGQWEYLYNSDGVKQTLYESG